MFEFMCIGKYFDLPLKRYSYLMRSVKFRGPIFIHACRFLSLFTSKTIINQCVRDAQGRQKSPLEVNIRSVDKLTGLSRPYIKIICLSPLRLVKRFIQFVTNSNE